MLRQIGQRKILGKMGLNVVAGALHVGFVAGGDLPLNPADLQVDDAGHAPIKRVGGVGLLNRADNVVRRQLHLAEYGHKGGVSLQDGVDHGAEKLPQGVHRGILGAGPAQKEQQRLMIGLRLQMADFVRHLGNQRRVGIAFRAVLPRAGRKTGVPAAFDTVEATPAHGAAASPGKAPVQNCPAAGGSKRHTAPGWKKGTGSGTSAFCGPETGVQPASRRG